MGILQQARHPATSRAPRTGQGSCSCRASSSALAVDLQSVPCCAACRAVCFAALRHAAPCCVVPCCVVLCCVVVCAAMCCVLSVLVLRELKLGYGLVLGLEASWGGVLVCAVCWF